MLLEHCVTQFTKSSLGLCAYYCVEGNIKVQYLRVPIICANISKLGYLLQNMVEQSMNLVLPKMKRTKLPTI